MTVFDRLRGAMEAAQADQDLPDYLAQDISAILGRQQEFARRTAELEDLVEKVTLYDTYGQTGYLGMGVNNVILQKALQKLLRP
jgi:hypothetical protein